MMTRNSDHSVAIASIALMLFLPSLLMHCATASGTVHIVGDGTGWIVPPNTNFYNTWASSKTFRLNDILTFRFTTNRHDVVRVPQASYDSCSSANNIGAIISTGPTNVTLTETGIYYYICSVGNHCQEGQKMAVTVHDSSSAAAPDASSPTSPSNPQPPPPPSPSSSASPPRVLAGFFLIMLSFVLSKLVL